jgi:protein tyrosine phosphatase (PTP) superfamily phosphohydrolase (DUF442 family)
MKFTSFMLIAAFVFTTNVHSVEDALSSQLADLKNYQVNSSKMLSSGLPNQKHFETLKAMGVTKVIDLIPGDRTEESKLMKDLNLSYHNIQVEWENPTIDNFNEYVSFMQQSNESEGKTLTHCRLNWRGAVFTYLYRVIHLKESENIAKTDMLEIWQPDEVWTKFIDKVKAQYL